MITKSIRLSEREAEEVARYLQVVGDSEAALLKDAALRGFQEIRLGRGILANVDGAPFGEAAGIAGLARGPFLHALSERGIALLRGESTIGVELDALIAAEEAAAAADDGNEPAP